MVFADWIRATLHASLAVLIFTGEVEVWQLCVIEALFGAAMAFFQPAYTGLIPQTVPERLIQEARALTQSIWHPARRANWAARRQPPSSSRAMSA